MKKILDDNQPHHCRVACRDRAGVECDFIFSKRRQKEEYSTEGAHHTVYV